LRKKLGIAIVADVRKLKIGVWEIFELESRIRPAVSEGVEEYGDSRMVEEMLAGNSNCIVTLADFVD
jgi:hypothetical protein